MHPRASSARFQFIEYVIHILHSEKIGKERGRESKGDSELQGLFWTTRLWVKHALS